MRRTLLVALAALVAAPLVRAHEGHAHKMMGTVTAVHADMNHVEIKTAKGAAESFYVDANTKYLKGTAAAKLADLGEGTRVVAEVKTVGGKMVATVVKIGGDAPAAPASPAASPHKH